LEFTQSEENMGMCSTNTAPLFAMETTYKLPPDIDSFALTKYTNVFLHGHQFGALLTPITYPFLQKYDNDDFSTSLSLFKLILRYSRDPNLCGKDSGVVGNYIVNEGIMNSKLRDEIYVQLCNQTWPPPSPAGEFPDQADAKWMVIRGPLS
jgi:myosin-15